MIESYRELEKGLIGWLIKKPELIDDLDIKDVFLDFQFKKIYKIIKELYDKNIDINIITLSAHGCQPSVLVDFEAIGSPEYLYDELIERHKKTNLKTIVDIVGSEERSREIIEKIEELLTKINLEKKSDIIELKEILSSAIERIELLYNNNGVAGLMTGIDAIDSTIVGLAGGDLIILGARPSVGKTALALKIAYNISKSTCLGFFSCEMCSQMIAQRLICMTADLDLGMLKSGIFKKSMFDNILTACDELAGLKLLLCDTPNIKLVDLKSGARKMCRLGAKIIIVDYLTLIRYDNNLMARHERVGQISKELKQLARELDIPIIVLSQVRRDTQGKIPDLSDLRQSGEIEEDADIVIFLHREIGEDKTQIAIAKNRNGSTGLGELRFNRKFCRYENLENF